MMKGRGTRDEKKQSSIVLVSEANGRPSSFVLSRIKTEVLP